MPRHPRPNKLRHFFLRRKSSPARVQVPTPLSLSLSVSVFLLQRPLPFHRSRRPPARPTDRQHPTTPRRLPPSADAAAPQAAAGRRRSIRRAASPETPGPGLGVSSAKPPRSGATTTDLGFTVQQQKGEVAAPAAGKPGDEAA